MRPKAQINTLISFNRTFMELKLVKGIICNTLANVLIVPLWNLNNIRLQAYKKRKSFNRTFMELK